MKKLVFTVLFMLSCLTVFGQNQKAVDNAVQQWVNKYNKQKFTEIYALYSPDSQAEVSLTSQTKMLQDVYAMMGKVKSVKFVSYKDKIYHYLFYAEKDEIQADVSILINQNLKFNYLNFDKIGGSGDPPPMEKMQ